MVAVVVIVEVVVVVVEVVVIVVEVVIFNLVFKRKYVFLTCNNRRKPKVCFRNLFPHKQLEKTIILPLTISNLTTSVSLTERDIVSSLVLLL